MRWIIAARVMGPVTLSGCGLVAALAWPLAASRSPDRSPLAEHGLLAVVGSALLSAALLGILALADALEGPALLGSTAAEESVIMIAAGTLTGMALVRRSPARVPLRGVPGGPVGPAT